jgi:hypothetical protein
MDDLPDALNRLATRLEILEQRVYVLEHPSEAQSPLPAQESIPLPAVQAVEAPAGSLAGGVFSVLGRAMLGIAGAYLLRAVAELSVLPRQTVAAIAILYAIAWLVSASRVKAGEWLAGTVYASTSALILAPMLWELTLRFKVLPAQMTAGVLCGFVIAASALAWKRDLAPVFWVANVTATAIALTLSIASHEIVPFIAVLLVMVLISEYGAGRNRETGVRVMVALAADVAIWAVIYIYASPQSTRVDYPVMGMATLLAPGFTLFLIFAASVIFKTAVQGKKITVFDTIQTMIAFLLAACGLLYFGPQTSATILGIFCLVLSAASYAGTFAFFDRAPDRMSGRRNYLVFASWSAALFLAGSLLCLPPWLMTVCLCLAAIVAAVAGARLKRQALELHGLVYLLAAAAVSGLLNDVLQALAGTLSGAPWWTIYVAAACAVLCYAAVKPCQGEQWTQQVVHIVFASMAAGAAAALLVQGLVGLIALSMIPGAHHVAFVRTLTLCAAALALAYSGAHWRRMELTRIGYAALVLVAVKLVFEDLRHGHLEFIAASIFLFAITLIAVPRVARMKQPV